MVAANAVRDWVDYAELGTGVLGALSAIVALVISLRSAGDARSSAEAAAVSATASRDVARFAEQQLELTRQQAEAARRERQRRPELKVSLAAARDPLHQEDAAAILTVTMQNEGSRSAEHAELRIGVGDEIASITSVRTPWGADPSPLPEYEGFAALGDGRPFGGWLFVHETHTIPAGASVPRHFRIYGQPGAVPFAVRLYHADAPEQGALRRGTLNLNWRDDLPPLADVSE